MKYVITGNSTAAVGAVEGIRKTDPDGEIVIISDEPHHTYSRPLISYLLLGKTTEEKMKYRGGDFYEKNGCTPLLGHRVVKILPAEKKVVTADGLEVGYDRLLVAAGSSPFVPPVPGLDSVKNKFTFMSLDDAKKLRAALKPDSRVLIVGAGLIGLKCAEGIFGSVGSVTVVDLADRILSSILDRDSADIIQKHLERRGLELRLSQSVGSFEGGSALLSTGERLDFDILVMAVGVRPNVSLVADIGGKVGRGIAVNDKMETSLPDIYAAGDCVESHDASSGQMRVMALLPNAYMQGECAGVNMAGGEASFGNAIPMNAIGFFGLHIITAGTYEGDVYFEGEGDNYKKLFYGDNRLNGYIMTGDVQKAGIYTNLIRERTPLDSIDFDLICKRPCLMAFTQADRNVKLGGAAK